jgi:hypothetical protein
VQVILTLATLVVLTACGAGAQASPTATVVDVNAVMTSAAGTAFVQLTQIAARASATATPAPPTETPNPSAGTAPALQLLTSTPGGGAVGLPPTETTLPGIGTATATSASVLTPILPISTKAADTCLNSKFAGDVTIPDGTLMKPDEKFRKIWRVQNTGTCRWDEGFGFTLWAGPAMSGEPIKFSINDQPVNPGGTVDMGIDMRAPTTPGDYVAHWIMVSDSGKTFGGDFTVVIKVVK